MLLHVFIISHLSRGKPRHERSESLAHGSAKRPASRHCGRACHNEAGAGEEGGRGGTHIEAEEGEKRVVVPRTQELAMQPFGKSASASSRGCVQGERREPAISKLERI